MILEIILLAIMAISLVGIIIIIRHAMSELVELSVRQIQPEGTDRNKVSVSKNLLLQKFLSKFRILVLKTDNKTSEWISRLKETSQENKTKFSDSYWDKLRK